MFKQYLESEKNQLMTLNNVIAKLAGTSQICSIDIQQASALTLANTVQYYCVHTKYTCRLKVHIVKESMFS